MGIAAVTAADVTKAALDFYLKSPTFKQTIQEKPLLRILKQGSKTFSGGHQYIYKQVQGDFMVANGANPAAFFAGFSADDTLTFNQAANILQSKWQWYEMNAGLVINWTELKMDGITITDSQKTSYHSGREKHALTDILKNRMEDFGESYSRAKNYTYWMDGSQDAKAMPGLLSILTDNTDTGIVGGLDRATYTWWRHRAMIGANKIVSNPATSYLIKVLRREFLQLARYGAKPNVGLCGSDFLDALRNEIHEKGLFTMTGFDKTHDIGIGKIKIDGVTFEWDPTLDSFGMAKRCYILSTADIQLMPMEGEADKTLKPERPYNQLVYLHSLTDTSALTARRLSGHGIYEIA